MSTIDLHMHCQFQSTQQGAVAIVPSPSRRTAPIYTLTPTGLYALQVCKKKDDEGKSVGSNYGTIMDQIVCA